MNPANYLKTPKNLKSAKLSYVLKEIFTDDSEVKLNDLLVFTVDVLLNYSAFVAIDFLFEDFLSLAYFIYFRAFVKVFIYIRVLF